MESLFDRRQPKQGRVCLMLGASLLLHSGVVGIGALWTQPEPELHSLPPFIVDDAPSAGPPLVNVPRSSVNETPEPTSTPELDVKVAETPPPPTDTPDFAQPPEPTPPSRKLTAAKPASAAHPANAQTVTRAFPGQSGEGVAGSSGNGSAKTAGTWVMPHPPYPRTSLSQPTGATTVRITTDASGRVSNVVILKSVGSPILDNQTESYVRMNWHGAANASRTTEFVYQLR